MTPGRACPLHYRYSPSVCKRDAEVRAETIYVIGGLYGNLPALRAIIALAAMEPVAPTLIFNGDFNWFNVDAAAFKTINETVLQHVALRGNVETELSGNLDTDDVGCGCAYPDYVDDADVERSNEILRRLRNTAMRSPQLTARLAALPMHLVAQVGDARIGIVHGDAESLAGWRFAHDSLHDPANVAWLHTICTDADLLGFASSHTCLPTLRRFRDDARTHLVINNGAAGMPNFAHTHYGLITRLSIYSAREGLAQYGTQQGTVFVDALPVHYDQAQFFDDFAANWLPDSPAFVSYARRINEGPAYFAPHALGLTRAPSVCA